MNDQKRLDLLRNKLRILQLFWKVSTRDFIVYWTVKQKLERPGGPQVWTCIDWYVAWEDAKELEAKLSKKPSTTKPRTSPKSK